ncbi:MAG: tRNA (adenosine(37)-N6)-threonylcarbamoyltransferase complex dimerization subunit type 1 TsaB, partial [Bacteroidetes bacterium]|nr:tRNA (adenosine(37)-N6)-threonylcarbamoyltransferase complex dimerization subunit type 1 TsaB [Bacteroidota bacterium]
MQTPLILNIETATEVCSVCLSRGTEVLSLRESVERNDQSKVLTLFIEQCMIEADLSLKNLDAVAVSAGPGSYTSLRVGISTAKGLCYALEKPLIAVSTLQMLAIASREEGGDPSALHCSLIDARRMEVYAALFDAGGKTVFEPTPMVIDGTSFQEFFSSGQRIIFSGNGAEKCKPVLETSLAVFSNVITCSAVQIISLSI